MAAQLTEGLAEMFENQKEWELVGILPGPGWACPNNTPIQEDLRHVVTHEL